MGTSKKDKKAIEKLQEEIKKQTAETEALRKKLDEAGIKVNDFINSSDEKQREILKENYDDFRDKYYYHEPCPEGSVWNWDTYECEQVVGPHDCKDPHAHFDERLMKCVCDQFYTLDPVTGKCVPQPTVPPSSDLLDKYGILKVYRDKPNGVQIFADEFKEDNFWRNYKSGGGEWSYENEHKSKRVDVQDIEATFAVKINDFKKEEDTLSIKLLGDDHSDGSSDKWLIFQVSTLGKPGKNFQIEDPHPKNHDNHQKTLFDLGEGIVGKWIIVKAITFKTADGQDRKAETWINFPVDDINNVDNTRWKKYIDIESVKSLSHGFVDATGNNVLLRIDGVTKDGKMPEVKYQSFREILPVLNTAPTPPPVQPPEPPTTPEPPTIPAHELDENGTLIPYERTGQKVALTSGNDHRNGQRYSVNHKFENYCVRGYFFLGKGQEQIEMKTDGPNHGNCKQLPQCCWVEADLAVIDRDNQEGMKFKAGTSFISSEFPHPVNHSPPSDQKMVVIEGIKPESWIGFSVASYWDNGFRHIELEADPDPFDEQGKPKNGWKKGVNEIDKGQITSPTLAKRKMAVDFDKGLEAEIRMHKATNHDCKIKWAYVWEIKPPV
mgnify:CR=1 FL=1